MSAGDYRVDEAHRLLRGSEVLLSGAACELARFADVLNAARPKEDRIAGTVRALMGLTPDCSYAPGERLLADGTPLRMVQPQRRERASQTAGDVA